MCHAPFVFFSFPLQAIAQWEEDSKERELEKQRPLQDCIFISMVWCCCCGAVAAVLLLQLCWQYWKQALWIKMHPQCVLPCLLTLGKKRHIGHGRCMFLWDLLGGVGGVPDWRWLSGTLGQGFASPEVGPISPLLTWVNGLLSASSSWLPPFIRDGEENGSSAKKRELHESAWNN